MIAKTGWFSRRKYMGWGFFPAAWQGWVYLAVLVGVIFGIVNLPLVGQGPVGLGAGAIVAILAFFDIFASFRQDERETIHEAFAERNAMWALVTVLAIGIAYQAAQSAASGIWQVDPVILIAIGAALVVKAASNLYLDRKD